MAQFLMRTIGRSDRYTAKTVSLATASDDSYSVRLLRPSTWLRGVRTQPGVWQGGKYTHVGARISELEFTRFLPTRALHACLADCDLIQVVCGSPAWALSVCGFGKPVAVQCATRAVVERRRRDAHPQTLLQWWRRAMTSITSLLEDRALGRVDAVQVENTWMLQYARRINANRNALVRYAPPGVDSKRFRPLPDGVLQPRPYILCVGRLDDPRKNVGLLLDAFARLTQGPSEGPELVLAGSSGPDAKFWRQVHERALADRVRFVPAPSPEHIVQLYQQASAFALASDEEGLGIVILEAMACGIPVVSTRSGGPDGIITDGEDGYLVPLDDAAALADRLGRLLADSALSRAMGRKARATIERRYTDEVAARAYLDVWEQLLARL